MIRISEDDLSSFLLQNASCHLSSDWSREEVGCNVKTDGGEEDLFSLGESSQNLTRDTRDTGSEDDEIVIDIEVVEDWHQ